MRVMAIIKWDDNSNAAGKRPETIIFKGNECSTDCAFNRMQILRFTYTMSENDFPDVENYTKSVKYIEGDSEYGDHYLCTYTYTGDSV